MQLLCCFLTLEAGGLSAADLDLHFLVLLFCDKPLLQKRVVVIVQPHFGNSISACCLSGLRCFALQIGHGFTPHSNSQYFR